MTPDRCLKSALGLPFPTVPGHIPKHMVCSVSYELTV